MAIKRGSKVDMNSSSASMTDLMFLLLIFLMIATTLINSNAIKVNLPQGTSMNKDKAVVVVAITPDLQYYVNDTQVEFSQLENVLREKLGSAEEKSILLRGDRVIQYNEVIKVMKIAIANDYKLALATDPE